VSGPRALARRLEKTAWKSRAWVRRCRARKGCSGTVEHGPAGGPGQWAAGSDAGGRKPQMIASVANPMSAKRPFSEEAIRVRRLGTVGATDLGRTVGGGSSNSKRRGSSGKSGQHEGGLAPWDELELGSQDEADRVRAAGVQRVAERLVVLDAGQVGLFQGQHAVTGQAHAVQVGGGGDQCHGHDERQAREKPHPLGDVDDQGGDALVVRVSLGRRGLGAQGHGHWRVSARGPFRLERRGGVVGAVGGRVLRRLGGCVDAW
jgi:hypothetical protein